MLEVFIITLREGLEAMLIVSVAWVFIQKMGIPSLLQAVVLGGLSAVVTSILAGLFLFDLGEQGPIFEGSLAFLAAFLVISCSYHMLRHGPKIAGQIRERLKIASEGSHLKSAVAVGVAVYLLILREGIETATMLASVIQSKGTGYYFVSGISGSLVALVICMVWVKMSHRLNIGLIFRVSTSFMLLFSLQLLVYGFHEISEVTYLTDNLPWLEQFHIISEPYGPEGAIGQYYTFLMIIVPSAVLLYETFKNRMNRVISSKTA